MQTSKNLSLKTLSLGALAAAALCLTALTPARADLIKSGAVYNRTVLMTSTADHITGLTGLTTFTVTLSKAGGTAATITPTVTEIGGGRYSVALATGNTGTLGALDLTITAAGADPADTHDQIVSFDPNSDLGAAALTTIGATTTSTNTLATGINTQTAKIGTNALDSPNEITAQGLVTSTNAQAAKISTNAMDSPNEVAAQTQATSNAAALTTANTGIATTNTNVAALPAANATAVWSAATKTITGGTVTTVTNPVSLPTTAPTGYGGGAAGDTPGTTTLLARIGTPVGATLSADIAGVPSAVWLYTASDGLTHQQSDALRTAVLLRGFSVAYNATTRTQVTTYFKADNSTVLATTTVVYDLTGRPATRTTAFTNLP